MILAAIVAMKPSLLLIAAVLSLCAAERRTMRLDYVHTGSATEEQFALDEVVFEAAWPGPADRLIDYIEDFARKTLDS